MGHQRLLAVATAVALAVSLALVPAAQAKVATGKYNCYTYGLVGQFVQTIFLGAFKLKAHGKYNSISPKKGKGKYVVKGKSIKFKTGPWKKFHGSISKDTSGKQEITFKQTPSGQTTEVHCFHT